MSTDRNVEQRALTHAALADPARLQIVDLLALGDWSPGELQSHVDLPSNLLAHHLNVLEHAGLVHRTRSEADGRRRYVRLNRTALDGLLTGEAVRARRVVFVCTANSARSQLAAALWGRASTIPATSGGTHPADRVEPAAVDTARRHGISLRGQQPQLLADVQRAGDFVVTVCDNAHEELLTADGLHWSIPDPVRAGSPSAFESAFAELSDRVNDLAPRVVAA